MQKDKTPEELLNKILADDNIIDDYAAANPHLVASAEVVAKLKKQMEKDDRCQNYMLCISVFVVSAVFAVFEMKNDVYDRVCPAYLKGNGCSLPTTSSRRAHKFPSSEFIIELVLSLFNNCFVRCGFWTYLLVWIPLVIFVCSGLLYVVIVIIYSKLVPTVYTTTRRSSKVK